MKTVFAQTTGLRDCLPLAVSGQRFMVIKAGLAVAQSISIGELAATRHAIGRPTPPVGTPTAPSRQGNSTPAPTPVAGFNQSERSGEHRGRK